MDTVVAELVNFFQAMKSGSLFHYLILLALVLIGLALIIAAVAYQRVVIKRLHTASKATQENSKTIAADLRERALEVKKLDEGLRKHELEVNERKQQQQVLKRSQRALKGSVSCIVTIGLKNLQRKPYEAALNSQEPSRNEGGSASAFGLSGPARTSLALRPGELLTAQGGLCHEASTRMVTHQSRSSATGAIDNSPGGSCRHWQRTHTGRTSFNDLVGAAQCLVRAQ
jgi:hypothetical protein